MKIVLLLINLFLAQVLGAQNYDVAMKNALQTWHQDDTAEASAKFEKIAAANPEQWLPNYYIGLINATAALNSPDQDSTTEILNKAQKAIDSELKKSPQNAELLVIQALIYTVYLAKDPMKNGQLYYPKVMEIYSKAISIAPENPRVVIEKARFDLESAKYVGGSTKSTCEDLQKAGKLLEDFKSDEPFYPDWGKDQLKKALTKCN